MSKSGQFVSFPEGYLGSRSRKFDLIANTDSLFAISKPTGMACFQHEWSLGTPDFSMALRRELLNEKPQLKRLGIEGVFRIYNLDAELSGVLLYAKVESAEETLKNAVGSNEVEFTYHFLANNLSGEREHCCDLPIARHASEARSLVSHKTGKKCETHFRYLRSYGFLELWEAKSRYIRPHQARLHAAEVGLSLVGETVYSKGEQVYLSSLKRGYRGSRERERPIYDAIAAHLVQVTLPDDDFGVSTITAPLPGKFSSLLKQLDNVRSRKW